jgi:hypothetical protein
LQSELCRSHRRDTNLAKRLAEVRCILVVDFEYRGGNRTKVTFGGSAMLLKGVIGIEADYAFVPRFFQNPDAPLGPVIANSHVQTLTGSVVPVRARISALRPSRVRCAMVVSAATPAAPAHAAATAAGSRVARTVVICARGLAREARRLTHCL